ncbi:MAG: ATP-dependent helicase [Candidatus Paceibacterota bacterium]
MLVQKIFETEYKKLNKEQRQAVDAIEGPVMVVAGPGTGKTQVLALRIANILRETQIKGDGILCLTFTNSGVRAMKERLYRYIGPDSAKVRVSTFHSFALEVISKHYHLLGFVDAPRLIEDTDASVLYDIILADGEWEHLKKRSDKTRYFADLRSMISLLKREGISPDDLALGVSREIELIKNNPENISSRGATKGELKAEWKSKIEALGRTQEAVRFYEKYEALKTEKGLLDYDDALSGLVCIVKESEDARADIREEFLYVLVDEHQDSSGMQNEFLQIVWGSEEHPNVFVVGDDRQLIYGFGGASFEYFENFVHEFPGAKLITLIENYRSVSSVLDLAHILLESKITKDKLHSNLTGEHPVRLIEAAYERDEILACGLEIKAKIDEGFASEDVAVLVPKNAHVERAATVLHSLGIPVAFGDKQSFFKDSYGRAFVRILRLLASPTSGALLTDILFDPVFNISPLSAHTYVRSKNMRSFSLLDVVSTPSNTLFNTKSDIDTLVDRLLEWVSVSRELSLYELVQKIGNEFFLAHRVEHGDLVRGVEVVRTMIHLVLARQTVRELSLTEFVDFLNRTEEYGGDIPLALFGAHKGVKIMTLHASKGLEFEYVWIAHLSENALMSRYKGGFALPGEMAELREKRDVEVVKRELYVAITRAKRFCTLSYNVRSYRGGDEAISQVLLPLLPFLVKHSSEETENMILTKDPTFFVAHTPKQSKKFDLEDLKALVKEDYKERKVSVSMLNNFFECPWKWYFRNILQLPEEKSDSLEFGNIVHNTIDKILKADATSSFSADDLSGIVKKEVEAIGYLDQKKEKEFYQDALKAVARWVEDRLGSILKNRKSENSVSLAYQGLELYGKIDLIEDLGGGTLRVTDFKTGSPRKKSDIEKVTEDTSTLEMLGGSRTRMSDYMRQLAMYSYLLSENKKWQSNVAESRLEFVESNASTKDYFYSTSITREQMDMLVGDIKDYRTFVESGAWVDMPCHFKPYGKSTTECPYCKMGDMYKK